MFFKKKKKERYLPITLCNLIIDDALLLKNELERIEKGINTLKYNKDITVYNEVLDRINTAEKLLKRLEIKSHYGVAHAVITDMKTELENYKRTLLLILFGAKFDHVD